MNERQRRFAEAFAACGNAAQAAREAGYSAQTARQQGQRLLTNADVLAYVRQLQDEAAAPRVATILQAKAFWSTVMNDPKEKTADRLKASELLARAAGIFLHTRPGDDGSMVAVGEVDGGDVVIYLPQIQIESEAEANE